MAESNEECALCQEELSKYETVKFVRDDGVATCNQWAKKRRLDVTFVVSFSQKNIHIHLTY